MILIFELTLNWLVWNLWQYLMPFVDSEKYTLPKNCRLHPDNDVFREQEENVDELRPMQWQCRYCKKVFRTREFLDMHFDNRHSEKLETVKFHINQLLLFAFLHVCCERNSHIKFWNPLM